MMCNMKQRFWSLYSFALAMLLTPVLALAQREPEREILDARLEGFPQNVTLEGGGTSLTWLLFVFLGIVCLSVLFKNAKRTHLD